MASLVMSGGKVLVRGGVEVLGHIREDASEVTIWKPFRRSVSTFKMLILFIYYPFP